MARWPLSLLIEPPKIESGLVLQTSDAQIERKILVQKLGLDHTPVKKIFYNSKTTIPLERYSKNILVMTSLNNYFFGNNPQADVAEIGHRIKFPYVALVGFLAGTYASIKKRKHIKLWLTGCMVIFTVSLFKKMDGWDLAMYPIIGIITIFGLREINKYKYGWLLLLATAAVGLVEIGRLLI